MTTLERLTTMTPSEGIKIEVPQIYFNFLREKTEDFFYECRKHQLYVDEWGNLIDKDNKLRYCFFEYYGYLAFAENDLVYLLQKNQDVYQKLKAEIKEVVKH